MISRVQGLMKKFLKKVKLPDPQRLYFHTPETNTNLHRHWTSIKHCAWLPAGCREAANCRY